MFSNNQKISIQQIKKLLVFDLLGISCLIVPAVAVRSGGRDGLFAIILGTAFAFLYALFFLWISNRIHGEFLNTKLFKIIGILYIIKLFFSAVFAAAFFSRVIHDTLLSDTDYRIVIGTLILAAVYLASKGVEERARVTEFLYYIVLIPILLFLVLGCFKIKAENLAPIGTEGIGVLLNGSYCILILYSVLELLLFILPFCSMEDKNFDENQPVLPDERENRKKKIRKNLSKAILAGVLTVGAINVLFYLVTTGIIGRAQTAEKLWSAVNVMQIIKMPGGFIQRQDAVMLSFWILSIFTLMSTFVYYLASFTGKILKNKKHGYFTLPIGIFIFLAACASIDIEQLFFSYGKYMLYIGLPQSVILPLLLILAQRLKKKGADESES